MICPECGSQTYDDEDDVFDLLRARATGQALVLGAVGESNYQPALKAALKRDPPMRSVGVQLKQEPDNEHDPYAVRICDKLTGDTLGYLKRRDAKQFHAAVAALRDTELLAGLTGGFRGRPTIGLIFDATKLRAAYDALRAGEDPGAAVAKVTRPPTGCGPRAVALLLLMVAGWFIVYSR